MHRVRGDTLSKALAACTAGRAEALVKRLQFLGSFIDICEAMAYTMAPTLAKSAATSSVKSATRRSRLSVN